MRRSLVLASSAFAVGFVVLFAVACFITGGTAFATEAGALNFCNAVYCEDYATCASCCVTNCWEFTYCDCDCNMFDVNPGCVSSYDCECDPRI